MPPRAPAGRLGGPGRGWHGVCCLLEGAASNQLGRAINQWRRPVAYELKCKACGQQFRHDNKEQLAKEVEEHNRKMHGQERLDRQAFEERVHQTV